MGDLTKNIEWGTHSTIHVMSILAIRVECICEVKTPACERTGAGPVRGGHRAEPRPSDLSKLTFPFEIITVLAFQRMSSLILRILVKSRVSVLHIAPMRSLTICSEKINAIVFKTWTSSHRSYYKL